tara:strand:- start:144 stop:806 length:663 start_codon:yes stop_codon:yes gene_type:complete
MEKHIVSNYDADLNSCKNMIIEMGIQIEKNLFDLIEMIELPRKEIFDNLLKNEASQNTREKKIRLFVLNTLNKRQPMADDLRNIIIALKISGILERINDHITNAAKKLHNLEVLPKDFASNNSVKMLAKATLQNLSTALKAYEQFSADLSKQVQVEDESINKLFKKVFEENSINIKNSKKEEEIDSYISMLFIAKEFERIGDLSKNIGKEVKYYISGKIN